MTTPPKNTTTLNKVVEANKAKDLASDKEAAKKDLPKGKVRVRLVRPLQTAEGRFLQAGVHELAPDQVPASAKIIRGNSPDEDDEPGGDAK